MAVITPPYQLPELRPFRTIAHRLRLVGGAVVTQNGILQSEDYVPGESGWIVYGNGDVEFNDGVFRGEIVADSFRAVATLIESWTFNGASTDGWVAVTGTLSAASDDLTITHPGSTPAARSPLVSGILPGLVYGVYLDGEPYADFPVQNAEVVEFYDDTDTYIGTGDWVTTGVGAPVGTLPYGRSMMSLAPAGATGLRVWVGAFGATDTTIDNVSVYQLGTITGTTLDTRPFEGAPGIRVGHQIDFLGHPDLPTNPHVRVVDQVGGPSIPPDGPGLELRSGDSGINWSHLQLLAGAGSADAALAATRIYLSGELYVDSDVNMNVLGEWQDYVPSSSGVTIGSGTRIARYMVIGKTCFTFWSFTPGAGSALASPVRVGLPLPVRDFHSCSAHYADAGGRVYVGGGVLNPTLNQVTLIHGDALNDGLVGSAAPFSFGSGDVLRFTAVYEVA